MITMKVATFLGKFYLFLVPVHLEMMKIMGSTLSMMT
jgi:hypothetical protein